MKKVLITASLLCSALFSFSNIIINEFEPNNTSTIKDPDFFVYSDWVELYNNGTTKQDVSGYYLSDKLSGSTGWEIPAGTTIDAGGYLLIWLDDQKIGENAAALHANFKLNANGDELALYSANKILLDSYSFGVVASNLSIGRSKSNENLWQQYEIPTPNAANTTTGSQTQVQQPQMSLPSGFYNSTIEVSLSNPLSGTTIYYTTNGTNPDVSSAKYSAPIKINRNTVLKAIAVNQAYKNSRITTQTYFVGERAITLPVVSIGVDSVSMFDNTTGMYSLGPNASPSMPNFGANFWEERELPASFEYFVNGKEKVQVNAGISIHGGYSRRFEQRSFAIHCGKLFGDERMEYQFFKSKSIGEFKSIILKNAGCDVNELKYRDGMVNTLAHSNMRVDYQAYQPSAVFINGHYWGILNVREKLTENYLKNNYGLDSSMVDMLYAYTDIYAGTDIEFKDMLIYFQDNDLNNETAYKYVSSMIDIDEFIDYQIAEIYIANNDWPGNNIRYWKQKGTGNKWRWILYDTDQSLAYYDYAKVTVNSLKFATSEVQTGWANFAESTVMLRKLLQNTTFRNLFVQRFAAHINSTFSSDSIIQAANRIETLLAGEKQAHLKRWGASDSAWNAQYNAIVDFAKRRPELMRGFIKQYCSIASTNNLTLKAGNAVVAHFKVSDISLKGNNIVGQYFANVPFTVEAINDYGYTFVEWQDANGKQISTNSKMDVTLTSDKTFVAVYEKQQGIQNVFINEFMASNKATIKDEANNFHDWIELYNANDYAVDLAGCYLTDDLNNADKFLFVNTALKEYRIPANGFLLIWADEETFRGKLHANFKLSASGEAIGLCQKSNNATLWIDTVRFGSQSDDVSMGRATDGSRTIVQIYNPSPGKTNGLYSTLTDEKEQNQLFVFPTVCSSMLHIKQSANEDIKIELFSILGEQVKSVSSTTNAITTLDVSNLSKGCYVVRIVSQSQIKEEKIFVR